MARTASVPLPSYRDLGRTYRQSLLSSASCHITTYSLELLQPKACSYLTWASSRRMTSASPQSELATNPLPRRRCFSSAVTSLATSPGPSRPPPPPRPTPSALNRDEAERHRHQFNPDLFALTPPEEHKHLPLVNSRVLAGSRTRPRACRMLVRDFIHDSLYNPHYGYFSRHAVLLPNVQDQQGEGKRGFESIRNETDYMRIVESSYIAFEKNFLARLARQVTPADRVIQDTTSPRPPPLPSHLRSSASPPPVPSQPSSSTPSDAPSPYSAAGLDLAKAQGRAAYLRSEQQDMQHDGDVTSMVARQVWHTPTQLFKPHYANIIAQHCIDSLRSNQPLIIYEMGAGSGANAECILDYVQQKYPQLYASMQYHIVEISDRLAEQQSQRLNKHRQNQKLTMHRKDVLQWDTMVAEECYVLGLEVLDNLSHDVLRYSTSDSTPYQCYVSIDSTGDMHELYTPVTDPLIKEYMTMYQKLRPHEPSPALPKSLMLLPSPLRQLVAKHLPFYPNLSQAHFIPTSSLKLLKTLARYFPKHRPIFSDFHALPKDASVKGVNGPIVQTRIGGEVVDVETYAVLQGFFDIFFPTDFDLLRDFHKQTMLPDGQAGRGKELEVVKHRAFLERYPDLAKGCQLKDGSNPMLSWYENASWLIG